MTAASFALGEDALTVTGSTWLSGRKARVTGAHSAIDKTVAAVLLGDDGKTGDSGYAANG